jgi:hypothetical protein
MMHRMRRIGVNGHELNRSYPKMIHPKSKKRIKSKSTPFFKHFIKLKETVLEKNLWGIEHFLVALK